MACSTTALAPSNSTDALFRLWGSAISAALSAAGWVQTSDTGQVNWTTVTAPVATNTAAGIEIWKTNDGGGLTTWYLKIEYGSGADASTPTIWITIGTGSNGSGTLTGQTSTRKQLRAAGNTTTTYNCHFGGGTSWFSMCMFTQVASGTNYAMTVTLERTKDNTGADTDVGFTFVGYDGSAASGYGVHQTVPKTGSIPAQDAFVPQVIARNSTGVSGTTLALYPVFPMIYIHYPAMLGVLCFYYNDLGDSTTVVVTRYGTSRTYMACRLFSGTTPQWAVGVTVNAGTTWLAPAIRYE